jgi:hypothetical protein
MANVEFSYNGMPVGYFEESPPPRAATRCRYMPYRGPGHLKMHTALARDQRVACRFFDGDQLHELVVDAVPEYGVLSIVSVHPVSSASM